MTFLAGERLWLLVVVAAALVAYVVLQLRRRTYAVRFTNLDLLDSVAPRRPGWRRHLPAAVFLLAACSLVIGFARPARDEQVPRERATIIVAIDTSLSMEADDVDPNRIEAAKVAAADFVALLPEAMNVGLVSFNGIAQIRVGPTIDHEAVQESIAALKLGEATAIGEAIFAGLDAIGQVPPDAEGTPPPARIVLMSDGETTQGRPDELAIEAAVAAGVPISTIAFGTPNGVIDIPGEPVPIPVPVDEGALNAIAEDTGGTAFAAATTDQLQAVYADIGSSIGFVSEQREIDAWFVGIGLALLLLSSALSLTFFSRLP